MFTIKKVNEDAVPLSWNDFSVEYFVEVREDWLSYMTKDYASDLSSARNKAKKYVHLGDVRIRERLQRTVETIPKIPVCT